MVAARLLEKFVHSRRGSRSSLRALPPPRSPGRPTKKQRGAAPARNSGAALLRLLEPRASTCPAAPPSRPLRFSSFQDRPSAAGPSRWNWGAGEAGWRGRSGEAGAAERQAARRSSEEEGAGAAPVVIHWEAVQGGKQLEQRSAVVLLISSDWLPQDVLQARGWAWWPSKVYSVTACRSPAGHMMWRTVGKYSEA